MRHPPEGRGEARPSLSIRQRLQWGAWGGVALAAFLGTGILIWKSQGAVGGLQVAATEHPAVHGAARVHGGLSAGPNNLAGLPKRVTFDRYIRPMLAQNCYMCHGPDKNYRKAGFRLDMRASLYAPIARYHGRRPFVPGRPDLSFAYVRMTSTNPRLKMPPAGSHLKVNPYDAALVKRWIEQGAKWQPHWSYTKLVRPPFPKVAANHWVRNGIDRFVLAKLQRRGLAPSREARRETLIRRVSLDIAGLPPTRQQVAAFVHDKSPHAYRRLVDRLLASPAYGEQMAVTWLDYARYADSYGFLNDPSHTMWLWRNWVINAFNKNMPFDQFTIKQLAGDLLPHPTINDKIATGFNRNNMITTEGGVIHEEYRVQGVIDRTDTTGDTWLGETIQCAQCHNHKYEHITHKDFYAFTAFFNSVNEDGTFADRPDSDSGVDTPPILRVPTKQQYNALRPLKAGLKTAQATLAGYQKQGPALTAAWEKGGSKLPEVPASFLRFPLNGAIAPVAGPGKPVIAKFDGKGAAVFVPGPYSKVFKADGSGASIEAGPAVALDREDKFSISCWVNRQGGGSILGRMDAPPTFRGFDLLVDGNNLAFHLIHTWPANAIKVSTLAALPMNVWTNVLVTYDGSSKAAGVRVYFNGQLQPTKTIEDTLTKPAVATAPLLIGRRVNSADFTGEISDVRFYHGTLSAVEAAAIDQRPAIAALLKIPVARRTPGQNKQLINAVLGMRRGYQAAQAALVKLHASIAAIRNAEPVTQIMQDLPKPRPTYILIRGQYNQHGPLVTANTPAMFPPMAPNEPKNRLGLAEWIMQRNNPLTARVLANRLWAKYFGRGLCKTLDNVGVQGAYPTHVKLLDYLATRLIAMRWNLKKFQKMIVTSATFRQCSAVSPALLALDPHNRLLARGPSFRLSAEAVRDQALAAAGLLIQKIGGPSVKPYEPLNLWDGNSYGNLAKYVPDYGPGLYRRSLYTFIKRSAPPTDLSVFDMPDRQICTIERLRTDTPLQALVTLNDPQYVEAARVLAQRMMTRGGATLRQRIVYACRRVICRAPTAPELQILLKGCRRALAHYKKHPRAAAALVHVGFTKPDPKLNVITLAGYTITASVLLNLDETLTCN